MAQSIKDQPNDTDDQFRAKFPTLETFKTQILTNLKTWKDASYLIKEELGLVQFGWESCTGAWDITYQIVDDRNEAEGGE